MIPGRLTVSKHLHRAVALLLVPCLLADPLCSVASAMNSSVSTSRFGHIPRHANLIETQAFMARGLFAGHPAVMNLKAPSQAMAASYRRLKFAAAGAATATFGALAVHFSYQIGHAIIQLAHNSLALAFGIALPI